MKIERFEDIKAWQEARKLVNIVYGLVKKNREFQKDFRLVGQITGAAVSSMSNIAEGFSRRSTNEFMQFLFIAKSSATEVQSQSYVALDQKYISHDDFEELYQQAEITQKVISGFITYLINYQKKNNPKQPKNPKNSTSSINSTNPKNSTNSLRRCE